MQVDNSDHYPRGFLLYTKGTEITGLAFRCEAGQLFAFLAVKPVEFKKMLQQQTRRPRNRQVSYKVNNTQEMAEEWVQMFSGKIYMVREISSTKSIFNAALTGATISFTRKYGKEVILSIPRVDPQLSTSFLASCKLKKKYRPVSVQDQ